MQFDQFTHWFVAYEGLDKPSPGVERCALFLGKAVALINADNPGKAARAVVQHLLDHRQVNAKPGHARRYRAAQVVIHPAR